MGLGRRQFGRFSSPCQHWYTRWPMLEERLNEDMKAALKGGDQVRLSTLRMLRSQVLLEKKKDVSITTLPDPDAIRAFQAYAKKLKESIAEYRKFGKAGDVEKIEGELRIVEEYLPAGLSEAESRELVRAVVSELGATSMKDMGRVMKEVQTRAQGRGDGKLLSDLVRTSLS
ncbi:MAG: GatB/YqeY domain-containing protein [Candidatus Eisenbacteria bacterium]|uniref:GatB/YqeY domain-containing protein n=1 Tax=Eiseniibacteriota bacterium TaxID=2212470 RepID=A0A538SHN4_UNCEI|nr:MAG: GatB/YqeY domain-containing protein [Candidatus Eisenbacteria bacterium]